MNAFSSPAEGGGLGESLRARNDADGELVAPDEPGAGPARKVLERQTAVVVTVVAAVVALVVLAGYLGWITAAVAWTLRGARAARDGANLSKKLMFVVIIVALEGVTQTFAVMGAGTVLAMGAGFLYGALLGGFVTTVGAMFGASLAYYFSKGRLQQFVQGKLADDGMVMQLSKALGSDGRLEPRETFLLIFLSRVPPLFPFALINYAYALTDMRFRMFFIPSFLGVWPCCTLDAYMGTLFEKLADVLTEGEGDGSGGDEPAGLDAAQTAEFTVSVTLTVCISLFLGWYVRRTLARLVAANEAPTLMLGPLSSAPSLELTAEPEPDTV